MLSLAIILLVAMLWAIRKILGQEVEKEADEPSELIVKTKPKPQAVANKATRAKATEPKALVSKPRPKPEKEIVPQAEAPEPEDDDANSTRSHRASREFFRNLPDPSIYLKPDGKPLNADDDYELWKQIRRQNVSATDARKLITLDGEHSVQRSRLLQEKVGEIAEFTSEIFQHGIDREPHIAKWVQKRFPTHGFVHNRNLYVGVNPRHIATPDMVADGILCEIKVTTKDAEALRGKYRDQFQWQMHVTRSLRVLLVTEHRTTRKIEWAWIERDQRRIEMLVRAADEFIAELDKLISPQPSTKVSTDNFNLTLIPETTTSSEGSVRTREIDSEHQLTQEEIKTIVRAYLDSADVYQISAEVNATVALVVTVLGRLIFGLQGELVDDSATRFGLSWSKAEEKTVVELYKLSKSVDQIAFQLERDRLGVLFRLFKLVTPPVPQKSLDLLGLA